MKWFSTKEPSVEGLETIKVDGKTFRVFTNPMKMPYKRVLAYFVSSDAVRLGIVRNDLDAFVNAARIEINKANLSGVAGLVEHLASFLDLYAIEKNLIQLGDCFIMTKGEDPNEQTRPHYELKLKWCEESEAIRAFFLSRSYNSLMKFRQQQKDFDISEYLKRPEVKIATLAFLKLIHSPTYKKRSTK